MPRLLVLLAAVCFGTTGTAQALGPDGASPAAVGAVRIVVGGALLALVAGWAWRRSPAARAAASLDGGTAALVVVGALGVVAYQPTFFAGVRSTGVAVGTLIALGSAPVLTGLVEWGVLHRPPTRRWALATALAAGGVAVLSTAGGGARLDPLGVLASLGAGASYAVYTLAGKALLERGWSSEVVMGATFGLAAVVMALMLPFLDLGWLATGPGLVTGLFLGVVPTAAAYLLFARGLRRLPASEVSTLTLAEPVTAGTLGVLLLGETAGMRFAVGAGLLVLGLAVLSVRRGARGAPVGEPVKVSAQP